MKKTLIEINLSLQTKSTKHPKKHVDQANNQ